jgi:hypothetical protein
MKNTDILIIIVVGYLLFSKKGIGYIDKKELQLGVKVEKEHKKVLHQLYRRKIKPNQAFKTIAMEHLKENPNYYTQLKSLLNPNH